MSLNPYKIELELDFGSLNKNQNKLNTIINNLKNKKIDINTNIDGLDKLFTQLNKIENIMNNLDVSILDSQIKQFSNNSNKGFDSVIKNVENYCSSIKKVKNDLSNIGEVKITSNQIDTLTNDILKFTATVKQANGIIEKFDYTAKNPMSLRNGHFKVLNDEYTLVNRGIIDNTDKIKKKNKKLQEGILEDTVNFVSKYNDKITNLYKNNILPENKIKNFESKINLLNGDESKKQLEDLVIQYEKLIQEEKKLKEASINRINSTKNVFEEQSKTLNYVFTQEEKLKNMKSNYNKRFDTNSNFYKQLNSQYNLIIKQLDNYKKKSNELTLEEKHNTNSKINDLKRLISEYILINNNIKKYEKQLDIISKKYNGIANQTDVNKLRLSIGSLDPKSSNIVKDFNEINKQLDAYESKLKEQQRIIKLGNKVNGKININSSFKDIEKFVKKTYGLNASISNIANSVDSMGNKIKQVNVNINEGGKRLSKYKMTIDNTTKSTYSMATGIENINKKQTTFAERMKTSIERLVRFTIAGTALFGVLRKLKEGVSFINDLNKVETDVGMVTNMNKAEIEELTDKYSKLADVLHTTTKEIMEGSVEFFRAGRNVEETGKLLESSTIGAKLSGQSTKDVSEQLIAITNGFRMEAKETMKVVDTLSTIDNNAATSFAELAEGMKRSSSSAQMAGVSMEGLSEYIGVVSSTTRKSAESIGESFKSIFARYQDIKQGKKFDAENQPLSNVERSLNKIGVAIRKDATHFKSFSTVIEDLGNKWGNLNDLQKSDIAKSLAGTRQRENFLVLMQNLDKVAELQEKVGDASGSAKQKFESFYSQSNEAKINDFKRALENLWRNLIQSDTINNFIKAGTEIINTFNVITSTSKKSGVAVLGLGFAWVTLFKHTSYITKGLNKLKGVLKGFLYTAKQNGIITALTQTFIALRKGITGVTIALLKNPLTWFIAILGVATYKLHKHIQYQKELKESTDSVKRSYDKLNQALKDGDKIEIGSTVDELKEKQNEYKELLKERKKLEKEINEKKSNWDKGDSWNVSNWMIFKMAESDLNNFNKKIDDQKKILTDAGVAFNEYTGEIYKVTEATNNLQNHEIIEGIQNTNEVELQYKDTIKELGNEYLELNDIKNKNIEEKERMSDISNKLKPIISGLITVEDEAGLSSIQNMNLIKNEIKILGNKKLTVQDLTKAKLEASKQDAMIQKGITKMTYVQAKKQIEVLQEKYNFYMDKAKEAEKNPSVIDIGSKLIGGPTSASIFTDIANKKKGKENELKDEIDKIDLSYEKALKNLDKIISTNNNEYIPSLDDTTKSTEKAKYATDEYANSIKALKTELDKLNSSNSKLYKNSWDYIKALDKKGNLIKQQIKLTEQEIKKNNQLASSYKNVEGARSGVASSSYSNTHLDNKLQGVLRGHGQDFVNAGSKYEIDPYLLASISMFESGRGTSPAIRNHNNPSGIMDWENNWKTIKHFNSIAEGIEFSARNLKNLYFNQGLTTIEQIGAKYAPIGASNDPNGLNKNWIPTVKSIYNELSGGGYSSGKISYQNKNSVKDVSPEERADRAWNKAEDLKQQLIGLKDQFNQLKVDKYESTIGIFDDKIKRTNVNASIYKDRAEQWSTSVVDSFKNFDNYTNEIKEKNRVLLEKQKYMQKQIWYGGHTSDQIVKMRFDLQDTVGEIEKMTKALQDAFQTKWEFKIKFDDRYFKEFDSEITEMQDKIDLLNVKDIFYEKDKTRFLSKKVDEQQKYIIYIQKAKIELLAERDLLKENTYEWNFLNDKAKEYNEKIRDIAKSMKQNNEELKNNLQSELDNLKSLEQKIIEIIKKRYETELDEYKKQYNEKKDLEEKRHKKSIDNLNEEKKVREEIIKSQLKEFDKNEKTDNYEKQLNTLISEKLKLQYEYNSWMLVDTLEGKVKKNSLKEQIDKKQEEIDDFRHKREIDLRKENLNDKLEDIQKEYEEKNKAENKKYEDTKERLDKELKNTEEYYKKLMQKENLYSEARKAIFRNQIKYINGEMMNLTDAILKYEDEWGEGLSLIGTKIKSNLIDNLQKAIDTAQNLDNILSKIKEIEKPKKNNSITKSEDKKVYAQSDGNNKINDYIIAQKYLSELGYEVIDITKLSKNELDKIKLDKNDLVIGNALNNKNLNGAGRLKGNDRYETDKIVSGYADYEKKMIAGDVKEIKNTVYGWGEDLKNAQKWLSAMGYKFVNTQHLSSEELEKILREGDIVLGEKGVSPVSDDILRAIGVIRLGGVTSKETLERIIAWASHGGVPQFSEGGVMDYSGLAMVHGSQSNSEVIFNSSQAKKLYSVVKNLPNGDNLACMFPKINTNSMPENGNGVIKIRNLLNVEGNVDENIFPKLKSVLKNDVLKELRKAYNKRGIYK
ncbi:phage tail tape measure protein [Clostridium rectalis]|uniref:phage tail tape measure protein n=1 Tax=Clostridium rectalis TaxID=2040295 RepID=UPI0013DE10CE|nr:phage tail tape measure protein [Clostridium rectalis]